MKLFVFLKEEYGQIRLKNAESLRDKTIFITGANGLIGGNILSYLYSLNYPLRIIAHSYAPPLPWLPRDKNITYLSGDLREIKLDFSFDFLIHAASRVNPKTWIEQKDELISLNVDTYDRLLKSALTNNAKVAFCSTSSVYGEIPLDKIPAREDYNGNVNLTHYYSLYGEAKRLGEIISQIYIQHFGLDVKILRLAIGYGAGVKLNDTRVISEFIKKALNGELTLNDSGSAIRQICFISDMVEMILNVLLSSKESLYNISGEFDVENPITIAKIAQIIANLTHAKVSFPAKEIDYGAHNAVAIDISKYCQEFNKTNFISMEYGLQKAIEWIKHLKDTL